MEFYSVKNFHRVALILSNYTTPLPAPVIFRNITESRGEEPAGHDGGSSANRFSNGKRKNLFEEMEGNLCSLWIIIIIIRLRSKRKEERLLKKRTKQYPSIHI